MIDKFFLGKINNLDSAGNISIKVKFNIVSGGTGPNIVQNPEDILT
jgi:hypothetical protein